MQEDLKIIKKKYGEKMMHLCRELFPTILENEGLLSKLMLDHFHPNHDLYDDIINNSLIDEFKSYIYSFVDVEIKDKVVIAKTPSELLSEVGYDLYECKTVEEVERFKKYYSKSEELCTFRDIEGRLKRCHIFFVIKKDVDSIRRENFTNPKRQDLYGTSVMSLQFTKDKTHTLSIKNRYNHSVNNPDSTFSNNLDNIIDGLTQSFENEYGLIQSNRNNEFEIPNYVRAKDGKYYKYNYEIDNIYYCNDNVIIDNFEAKTLNKERYILLDYFILDMQDKKIILYDRNIDDSFIESIGKIKKVNIEKENDNKKIIISVEDGQDVIITLDRDNRITGLINSNVKEINDVFLSYNEALTTIDLPNVEIIGDSFLVDNEDLIDINLPNVKIIGDVFLGTNCALTTLYLPNVQTIGYDFLYYNNVLTTLYMPNIQTIRDGFLHSNNELRDKIIEQIELNNRRK